MQYITTGLMLVITLILTQLAMANDEQLPPDTNIPCLKEAITTYKQAKADDPDLPHEMLIAIGGARYQQCLNGSKNAGSQADSGSKIKP